LGESRDAIKVEALVELIKECSRITLTPIHDPRSEFRLSICFLAPPAQVTPNPDNPNAERPRGPKIN
jgi:hypothetical protein